MTGDYRVRILRNLNKFLDDEAQNQKRTGKFIGKQKKGKNYF
jgi:hypothetical protein